MSAEFPSVPDAASASALFSRFNSRLRAGEPVTIDVLCAEHPEHASELREMHSIHLGLARSLETEGLRSRDAADPAAEALLASYQGRKGLFESRYRIDGTIGSGGMGVILRAFDTDVGREVAIKIIRDQDALLAGGRRANVTRSILARFLNEARITGQLEHPAIVPVHEIGVDGEGRPFFAMKLVHGRELSAVLKEMGTPGSAWTRERVLDVLLRVCDALAYAHGKEIIHRDLKPSNVMVGDFGEVYVMDWGLAKRVGQPDVSDHAALAPTPEFQLDDAAQSDPGAVLGTAYYMAPEQATGDRALMGVQSDVYAIGAMLYELLSGRPPFHREGESSTPTTIRERQSRWDLEPLPDAGVPAELQAICRCAMARESAARYHDMRELARDLRAFLDGRVVAAYEVGAWAEARKWVARNRTASLLAVVVLILGIGAVSFAVDAASARSRTAYERRDHELSALAHTYERDRVRLESMEPLVDRTQFNEEHVRSELTALTHLSDHLNDAANEMFGSTRCKNYFIAMRTCATGLCRVGQATDALGALNTLEGRNSAWAFREILDIDLALHEIFIMSKLGECEKASSKYESVSASLRSYAPSNDPYFFPEGVLVRALALHFICSSIRASCQELSSLVAADAKLLESRMLYDVGGYNVATPERFHDDIERLENMGATSDYFPPILIQRWLWDEGG